MSKIPWNPFKIAMDIPSVVTEWNPSTKQSINMGPPQPKRGDLAPSPSDTALKTAKTTYGGSNNRQTKAPGASGAFKAVADDKPFSATARQTSAMQETTVPTGGTSLVDQSRPAGATGLIGMPGRTKTNGFGDSVQTAANIASIVGIAAPVAQAAKETFLPDTRKQEEGKALLEAAIHQQDANQVPARQMVPWKGAAIGPALMNGLTVAGNIAAIAPMALYLGKAARDYFSPSTPDAHDVERTILLSQLAQQQNLAKSAGIRDAFADKLRLAKDFGAGAVDASLDELEAVVHRNERIDPRPRLMPIRQIN